MPGHLTEYLTVQMTIVTVSLDQMQFLNILVSCLTLPKAYSYVIADTQVMPIVYCGEGLYNMTTTFSAQEVCC